MRYILKYKNKEDFLEENPKEEVQLPVIYYYPMHKMYEYFSDGSVETDKQTGEVTEYEPPIELEGQYEFLFKDLHDANDLSVWDRYYEITKERVTQMDPVFITDLNGKTRNRSFSLKSGATWPQGHACLMSDDDVPMFLCELLSGASSTLTQDDGNNWFCRTAFTFYSGSCCGSISALTSEDYGYSGMPMGFYPTSVDTYGNFYGAMDENQDFVGMVFVVPSDSPVSSYTITARVINLVSNEERHFPGALLEQVDGGYQVNGFFCKLGEDLSACGYTATKDQWFGVHFGFHNDSNNEDPNSGVLESINPGDNVLGADGDGTKNNYVPDEVDYVGHFDEFYTNGETGMTEWTIIANYQSTFKGRQYYTVFYRTGDPITPYFAINRIHTSSHKSNDTETTTMDGVYDGYYEIYSSINNLNNGSGGYTTGGTMLSGCCGAVTIINSNPGAKEHVTKIEPGFAHVLTPESVYYNNLSGSGGGSSDFVIPGADTDAPGSNLLESGGESEGGQIFH